jgi:hypothetical protein
MPIQTQTVLINYILERIKSNGNRNIDGPLLQDVLVNMAESMRYKLDAPFDLVEVNLQSTDLDENLSFNVQHNLNVNEPEIILYLNGSRIYAEHFIFDRVDANNHKITFHESLDESDSVTGFIYKISNSIEVIQSNTILNEVFESWSGVSPNETPDNWTSQTYLDFAFDANNRIYNDNNQLHFIKEANVGGGIDLTIQLPVGVAQYRVSFDLTYTGYAPRILAKLGNASRDAVYYDSSNSFIISCTSASLQQFLLRIYRTTGEAIDAVIDNLKIEKIA